MKKLLPILLVFILAGCDVDRFVGARVTTHGYQFNPEMLELVPEGSSREHVLLSLGVPNTTQIADGGFETFYYISQKQSRRAGFLRPEIIEQTIMAVDFDNEQNVSTITNYGIQDGKVFAFNREITTSGGERLSLLGQLFLASQSVINPIGAGN